MSCVAATCLVLVAAVYASYHSTAVYASYHSIPRKQVPSIPEVFPLRRGLTRMECLSVMPRRLIDSKVCFESRLPL
jgi:hypothetical protein